METAKGIIEELDVDISCVSVVGDALNAASEAHGYSQRECENLALLMGRLIEAMRSRLTQLRSVV